MPKKLTVSIVIPVYNEAWYLSDCLDAIARQTKKPDEVIVVDNNSTDGSADVAKKYDFVKLLREPKQGIIHARSRGFNAAKGDIIGRTDGDVILPKDWVATILAFYSNKSHLETAITGGGFPNNLRFPRVCGWLQGHIAFRINRLLMGHYILFGSNMAVPKKLWLLVRNQTCQDTKIHEDLDLAIHLNRAGYEIIYDTKLMVNGRAHRVITHREQLLPNLMMWPRTLRHHGKTTWVFGWLGAVILYVLSPIPLLLEYLASLIGRPPLQQ